MLLIGLFVVVMTTCHSGKNSAVTRKKQTYAQDSVTHTPAGSITFGDDIQPILQARCVPCHFPGGKMYSRMPFDTVKTLLEHQEGITRRIKDPAEAEKLKQFLSQF